MRPPWIDLSHPIGEETPRIGTFPPPEVRRLFAMPADPMNVTAVDLCCHVGTHVDAPAHFLADGEAIEEIGLERLAGPGRVVSVAAVDDGRIDAADLERAGGGVREGEIVLLRTDWSRHVGTQRYERHPCLTQAAADWLVARRVKMIGFDFATPDLPLHARPVGFDWPVHRRLLGAGVLIAENLTGLDALPDATLEVICFPLAIRGGDGAPARIVARRLGD